MYLFELSLSNFLDGSFDTRIQPMSKPSESIEERLSQSLREFAKRKGYSLERAAEALGLSRGAAYNRAARVPSASLARLRQHVEVTDDSADWLLGFDVPRNRRKRAPVGVLSTAIGRLLEEGRPPHAFEPEDADVDPARLAEALVGSWWRSRLLERAREGASKLRDLAYEVRKAGHSLEDPRAQSELTRVENQCLYTAGKLESQSVDWVDLAFTRFPNRARQHFSIQGGPVYKTPFIVTGGSVGLAFLWHGDHHDVAVYLQPARDVLGSIGNVRVRSGNKRTPRFLVEWGQHPSEISARATPVPPQAKAPGRKSPGRSRK